MNRILTCPHCGPTLTEARLRCDRCGRELVYISEDEFTGREAACESAEQQPATFRRAGTWVAVTAAVAVVVATGGTDDARQPGARITGRGCADADGGAAVRAAGRRRRAASAGPRASRQPDAAPAVASGPATSARRSNATVRRWRRSPPTRSCSRNVGQILVAMNQARRRGAVPREGGRGRTLQHRRPFRPGRRVWPERTPERGRGAVPSPWCNRATPTPASTTISAWRCASSAGTRRPRRRSSGPPPWSPARAPAWLGLALSLEADGRRAEAATALERYLALEPAAADADNVRARIARLRATAEPAAPPPDAGSDAARRRPLDRRSRGIEATESSPRSRIRGCGTRVREPAQRWPRQAQAGTGSHPACAAGRRRGQCVCMSTQAMPSESRPIRPAPAPHGG